MNDQHGHSSRQKKKSDELYLSLFRAARQSSRQSIQPKAKPGPVSLSVTQQQMWFLHQLAPKSPVYNAFRAFVLKGPLNIDIFKASLQEIVRRHEPLSTTVKVINGHPMQVAEPEISFHISLEDWTSYPDPAEMTQQDNSLISFIGSDSKLQKRVLEETRTIFDLSQGARLRVTLFKLSKNKHLFLIVMPHIVCDGFSLSIFFQELITYYNDFSVDQSPSLSELSIQYKDYVYWQKSYLQSKKAKTDLTYWKEQLLDSPGPLNLPTDFPRPPAHSFRGASEPVLIQGETLKSLKTLSHQEGTTLYMVLLAALKTLLFRYSGQTDIIIGSPFANREHKDIQNLIGCFINTLAIRSDLSGNPTFRKLLSRVRKVTMEAFEHRQLPLQSLVEAMQPERESSFSPLFNVAFILQNTPRFSQQFQNIQLTPVLLDNKTAKYDLNLVLEEDSDVMHGRLEYSTDLFSAATIKKLINSFNVVLDSIVANPNQTISKLPLLTKAEEHQILVNWNDTQREYPQDKCIHQLFEEQAARTSEVVAVFFEDWQLTYGELNERANQLARYLTKLGVGPEMLIPLCAERSLDLIVGIIGILKAGGAYVPLDPDLPKKRLAFILEDCRPKVILTQEHLQGYLPNYSGQVVCLDRDWHNISTETKENLVNITGAEAPVSVIYTSGSTGKPKGCLTSHKALSNRIFWMQETYQITSKDCILQKTPFSFDFSAWELFGSVIAGASMVMAKPGGHKDARYLTDLIKSRQITMTHFVPSMLDFFLQEEGVATCSSLKRVFCGGEKLTPKLQEQFFCRLPTVELCNLYGPTEAAIDVAHWVCQRQVNDLSVPIGRPVANTQLYILDNSLKPVPVGVPGELHVGGVQVSQGYLNRPKLTAERFIPDPFSADPKSRLYKTGDRARYRSNGAIEFLDRIDHQIKIRGFRIEPGEIETVLKQRIDIDKVLVTARETTQGPRQLTAYIVSRAELNNKEQELRNFLKETLPEYMIPTNFIVLEEFPFLPNGKIDRQALPLPCQRQMAKNENSLPLLTQTEEKIQTIWQNLLNIDRVNENDDFFNLGGHSLLAMQMVAWIRRDLQIEISIRDIFDFPILKELAAIIDEKID